MANTKTRAIFIVWDTEETDAKPVYGRYGYDLQRIERVNSRIVKKEVCWVRTASETEFAKRMAQAEAYLQTDMADKINPRIEIR